MDRWLVNVDFHGLVPKWGVESGLLTSMDLPLQKVEDIIERNIFLMRARARSGGGGSGGGEGDDASRVEALRARAERAEAELSRVQLQKSTNGAVQEEKDEDEDEDEDEATKEMRRRWRASEVGATKLAAAVAFEPPPFPAAP